MGKVQLFWILMLKNQIQFTVKSKVGKYLSIVQNWIFFQVYLHIMKGYINIYVYLFKYEYLDLYYYYGKKYKISIKKVWSLYVKNFIDV